jgi:hypothetical protein
MLLALMLAAATAAAPAAPAAPAANEAAKSAGPMLDLVPAFIGACMNPGPEISEIRAVVIKAGGKPLPADPKAPDMEGFVFETSGLTYSVILDKSGSCSIVGGRVDLNATRRSLDQLVISSSQVFDISQTDAKPHTADENIAVEYKLTSKEKDRGLLITLSTVSRDQKVAVFLTRRIFGK